MPHLPPRSASSMSAVRLALAASLAAMSAALLLACASPLPALTWVRLPADAPGAEPPTAAATREVWQLMTPVALPGYLDRDALLVGAGTASLQPLGGARWAEPLRDAVPRLLQRDLTRVLGVPLWMAPLPPGVLPTRQLRVALDALDVLPDGSGVRLQARWTVADPQGAAAPQVAMADFVTPAAASSADALAAAHRLAIWQLAQRIAAGVAP